MHGQGCFGVDSLALPGDRHTKNFFESFGLVARAIIVHRSLSMTVARPSSRWARSWSTTTGCSSSAGAAARPPGAWSVPGGKVEHGETLAEAVTRELREETGLEGVCGPLLGWAERIDADDHFVILDFEVTLVGDDQPVAGDDAAEAAWVELHEVAELRLVEGLAEFLHDHGIIATFT